MEMSIRGVSIMQDILKCLGSLDGEISIKSIKCECAILDCTEIFYVPHYIMQAVSGST